MPLHCFCDRLASHHLCYASNRVAQANASKARLAAIKAKKRPRTSAEENTGAEEVKQGLGGPSSSSSSSKAYNAHHGHGPSWDDIEAGNVFDPVNH